jgi:hypothetical protein
MGRSIAHIISPGWERIQQQGKSPHRVDANFGAPAIHAVRTALLSAGRAGGQKR